MLLFVVPAFLPGLKRAQSRVPARPQRAFRQVRTWVAMEFGVFVVNFAVRRLLAPFLFHADVLQSVGVLQGRNVGGGGIWLASWWRKGLNVRGNNEAGTVGHCRLRGVSFAGYTHDIEDFAVEFHTVITTAGERQHGGKAEGSCDAANSLEKACHRGVSVSPGAGFRALLTADSRRMI